MFFHEFFVKCHTNKQSSRTHRRNISHLFPQSGNSEKSFFYSFTRIAFRYDISQKKNQEKNISRKLFAKSNLPNQAFKILDDCHSHIHYLSKFRKSNVPIETQVDKSGLYNVYGINSESNKHCDSLPLELWDYQQSRRMYLTTFQLVLRRFVCTRIIFRNSSEVQNFWNKIVPIKLCPFLRSSMVRIFKLLTICTGTLGTVHKLCYPKLALFTPPDKIVTKMEKS